MILTTYRIFRRDTNRYTIKDIQDEIEECRSILVSLGYVDLIKNKYTVVLNSRAKNRYGQCSYKGGNNYTISINSLYLQVGNPQNIHNTIMHEVIHSVPGCMNHKEPWKIVAKQVMEAFPNYNITRCGNDNNYHSVVKKQNIYHYTITCPDCGKLNNKYQRRPKCFDSIYLWNEHRYHCPHCGSYNLVATIL